MVTALVGPEYLLSLAHERRTTPFVAATALWLGDRPSAEADEVITRAVDLAANVVSYAEARRIANNALATARSWDLPRWQPTRFEIGLRLTLSSAANDQGQLVAAIGQADDGLALTAQMTDGPERTQCEARLRSNRAGALLGLGRPAEAAADFERAKDGLAAIGATTDGLRVSFAALRARYSAGQRVGSAAVRRLVAGLEAAAGSRTRSDGSLMADLEHARRWLLSVLAEEGSGDLETVVGLIEALRGDQLLARGGTHQPDPVVARISRPFTLLRARLGKLRDTTLVILEPRLGGERERAMVCLVISSPGDGEALRWHLLTTSAAGEKLRDLENRAADERERLLTGEMPLRAAPSKTLSKAAAAAWEALPHQVRDAVRSARTVLYMPSGLAGLDTIPFELLHHEGGWLGTTHTIARCPSFQYLETLLASGARRPPRDARALVAYVAPDERLGLLTQADAEAKLALRAAALLGFQPERRELADREAALEAFSSCALQHYIGHGFASAIGEVLPLSADKGVSASELPDADGGPAPFAFFNACLLGRVRHLPGGRQRGWALRLLDRGAPAVIGALTTVPDSACMPVAEAFYAAAWKAPIGEAMRQARARLNGSGMHPLVWSAYVLHGNPNARISVTAPEPAADLAHGWPALATQFLATSTPEHHDALLDALKSAPGSPPVLTAWAIGAPVAEDDLAAAADQLLDQDPEGAAVCRILLALARLDREPDNQDELAAAYLAADALQDAYAVLHVITIHFEAFQRHYPSYRQALLNDVRWWTAALQGDPAAVNSLKARLLDGT
jgi:hypothetical protein